MYTYFHSRLKYRTNIIEYQFNEFRYIVCNRIQRSLTPKFEIVSRRWNADGSNSLWSVWRSCRPTLFFTETPLFIVTHIFTVTPLHTITHYNYVHYAPAHYNDPAVHSQMRYDKMEKELEEGTYGIVLPADMLTTAPGATKITTHVYREPKLFQVHTPTPWCVHLTCIIIPLCTFYLS